MVKQIIGPHLLTTAPLERDMKEATDLIVLRARDMMIGVRLRRKSRHYWASFPYDFTLRCKRDNGAPTELAKIVDGWGDCLFYGHADDAGIDPWALIDLKAFRAVLTRQPDILRKPDGQTSGMRSNGDGTHFAFFNRLRLPPAVTMASSDTPQIGVRWSEPQTDLFA